MTKENRESEHLTRLSELSSESLRVELWGPVLFVTFQENSSRNAFDHALATQLFHVLKTSMDNDMMFKGQRIGVIALCSGVEGVFASGGHLKEIMAEPEKARLSMNIMRNNCQLLTQLPALSVCLLGGVAIGGGAELALAADERWLIHHSAALELRQRNWNLPFGWGGGSRLEQLRPQGGSRRSALDCVEGRRWNAEDLLADQLAQRDFTDQSKDNWTSALMRRAENFTQCSSELARALLTDSKAETATQLFDRFWLGSGHQVALKQHLERGRQNGFPRPKESS